MIHYININIWQADIEMTFDIDEQIVCGDALHKILSVWEASVMNVNIDK